MQTNMKLLVLYQARNSALDQPGYYDGFERLVREGLLDAHAGIPVFGVAEESGWSGLWAEAERTARHMQADAIFLQFFHAAMPDPTEGIRRLKNLPNGPTLFTSMGDGFGRWFRGIPKSLFVASAFADVSFLTGMGDQARQLQGSGSNNLVLMPHGCCQVRFSSQQIPQSEHPEFDVCFVGNRLRPRNLVGHEYWGARKRGDLVQRFTRRYGRRFALFGNGWNGNSSWQGPVPYQDQQKAYRRSAVVLGGMPGVYHDYYTSDREFIAIASGVPFVDYWVRGVEQILKPGRDWWLARRPAEMFSWCDHFLDIASYDRIRLGEEAREQVLRKHTQYHRCKEMIEIARSIRIARLSGRRAAQPTLSFLSRSCATSPARDAIVRWEG